MTNRPCRAYSVRGVCVPAVQPAFALSPFGLLTDSCAFTVYMFALSRVETNASLAGEYERTQQPARGACAVCVAATFLCMVQFTLSRIRSEFVRVSCLHTIAQRTGLPLTRSVTLGESSMARDVGTRGSGRAAETERTKFPPPGHSTGYEKGLSSTALPSTP